MELYCAIDLLDGRAVRLVQGDFGRCSDFGDPIALAHRLVGEGATLLHLVDLEAARSGLRANRDVVHALLEEVAVPVQVGGGIRTRAEVVELVGRGARWVVMGTAALSAPEVVREAARENPGTVVLALDYRRGARGSSVATQGWLGDSGLEPAAVLEAFAAEPLGGILMTAIERDGTGEGPDTAALGEVLDVSDHRVIASGGVGSLDHLAQLASFRSAVKRRGPSGAVVGSALLAGSFTVAEASRACERSG
ncbi:MAG: HisA/HisF-related TIM barrel protein [Acidimicrobiales bacterium]